jgi:hypothetical protein
VQYKIDRIQDKRQKVSLNNKETSPWQADASARDRPIDGHRNAAAHAIAAQVTADAISTNLLRTARVDEAN